MKFRPIKFPQDSLPHHSIIEWWYFNGHLTDQQGRRYAFMDCLFKADLKKINLPFFKLPFKEFGLLKYGYAAHAMLFDIGRKKSYKEIQPLSIMSRDSFSLPLFYANYFNPLSVGGFVGQEIRETEQHNFQLKTENFILNLTARKQPLLEGGRGFINACGRQSYYYSLTDVAAAGQVKIGDQWRAVKGRAWMDHQWADEPYNKDKWTWFSLQLNNGLEIMAVQYDDGQRTDCLASLLDARGRKRHYRKIILQPGRAAWQSPKTKAVYPKIWTLEIPGQKIRLTMRTLLGDQEMIFGTINYWEGPVEVSGEVAGQAVRGQGFIELTNYESDYNFLLLAGKDFNQKIKRAVSNKLKKFFK